MTYLICTTCGVQMDENITQDDVCPICTDERQYVNPNGQSWTTLPDMISSGTYQTTVTEEQQGLQSLVTTPKFGIGQTAYLVAGTKRILWDCITYLDQAVIEEVGQLDAMALSHPHYYATQVEWAETFEIPLYIHEADKEWVTRPSERIVFWSGDRLELADDVVLHRIGGHFDGATVLEWTAGDEGRGILLTGDIIRVVADRAWVSFMYSYPNLIPLPAVTVAEMASALKDVRFNQIYDAFHKIVVTDAKAAVARSASRYIEALNGHVKARERR